MELDKVIVLAAIGLYALFKSEPGFTCMASYFSEYQYVIFEQEHKSLNTSKMGTVQTHLMSTNQYQSTSNFMLHSF